MGVPDFDPGAFRTFEAASWDDGRAEPYDRAFGPVTSLVAGPLLDAAATGAGTRLLDVACGPGYVAGLAASRGAIATGVDIAPQMLELARALHPGVDFRAAEAESLPFADASFDAVVASFLLPHLADAPAAVAELARVLAPGGRLALSTWHSAKRVRFLGAALDAAAAVGATAPDLPPGPSFFQYAEAGDLRSLLEGCGLTEIAVETLSFDHRVEDFDALWEDLLAGTVRTAALVAHQDPATRDAIRDEYRRILAPYRDRDAYELPCAVVVGTASRRRI